MTLSVVFARAGQVVPDHRRPRRSERAGVRSQRQVSLPVRIDRRRPGARLVRAIDGRQPPHAQRLSRRPAQRSAVAARQGERRGEAGGGDAGATAADRRRSKPAPRTPPRREPVRIDFEGIEYRILDLPIAGGDLSEPAGGRRGPALLPARQRRTAAGTGPGPPAPPRAARCTASTSRSAQDEQILDRRRDYRISADGKKLLYRNRDAWSIVPLPARKINAGRRAARGRRPRGPDRSARRVGADLRRSVAHQPRLLLRAQHARRRLAGDEGEVRRAAARRRASRSDLNRVIQWMSSELSVGHHRGGGGDRLETPRTVPGGLLGADYARRERPLSLQEGLRRPQLESAAARAAHRARRQRPRRRVSARRARPRRAAAREHLQLLREHAGKIVEITVGPNADGTRLAHRAGRADRERSGAPQSRLGRGQPAEGGRGDRRTRRVRLRAQHRASPATTTSSATSIRRRTRTPSSSTSASTAAARSPTTTSTCCGGRSSATGRCATATICKTPAASIQGPKVMIIDETAGSGGDLLPWMFRKFKLGTLVGQRTWGGLVGMLGFPTLMDGGIDHRAEPRDLDAGRRLGRRERRRAAGHRGRADAEGRDRRPRSAARARDRGGAGGAEEEPAAAAEAAGVSRAREDAARDRHERRAVASNAGLAMFSKLRYAVRQLIKSPGFTFVAVARPRARHRRQRRAVQRGQFGVPAAAAVSRARAPGPVELDQRGAEFTRVGFSYPRFLEVRERQQVFSDLSLSAFNAFTMTGRGDPEQVIGLHASATLLPTLGVEPVLGRNFRPTKNGPAASRGARQPGLLAAALQRRAVDPRPGAHARRRAVHHRRRAARSASSFPLDQFEIWVPRPAEVPFLVPSQMNNGGFFFQSSRGSSPASRSSRRATR